MNHLPVCCTLPDAALARRREELLDAFKPLVGAVVPLDDGYSFRLDTGGALPAAVAEMIALERECCRFLRFVLRFEPDGGPVWLDVTGPPGTREFIETELGLAR